MPDIPLAISGDSKEAIACQLLAIHLREAEEWRKIMKDINLLLQLYRQCLRAVKDQPPPEEPEE